MSLLYPFSPSVRGPGLHQEFRSPDVPMDETDIAFRPFSSNPLSTTNKEHSS
jgi:hypothetical protein